MAVMATTAVQLLLASYPHTWKECTYIASTVSYRGSFYRKRKEPYIVSTASLANEYGHFVVLASAAVPNSKQTGF